MSQLFSKIEIIKNSFLYTKYKTDRYRVGQRNPEKTYDDISDLYLRN